MASFSASLAASPQTVQGDSQESNQSPRLARAEGTSTHGSSGTQRAATPLRKIGTSPAAVQQPGIDAVRAASNPIATTVHALFISSAGAMPSSLSASASDGKNSPESSPPNASPTSKGTFVVVDGSSSVSFGRPRHEKNAASGSDCQPAEGFSSLSQPFSAKSTDEGVPRIGVPRFTLSTSSASSDTTSNPTTPSTGGLTVAQVKALALEKVEKDQIWSRAVIFDARGHVIVSTCVAHGKELRAMTSLFDDRTTAIQRGLFLNGNHFDLHKWNPPLAYGRRGKENESEGIAVVRGSVTRNSSLEPMYMLVTYDLPIVSSLAVPELVRFFRMHLGEVPPWDLPDLPTR